MIDYIYDDICVVLRQVYMRLLTIMFVIFALEKSKKKKNLKEKQNTQYVPVIQIGNK